MENAGKVTIGRRARTARENRGCSVVSIDIALIFATVCYEWKLLTIVLVCSLERRRKREREIYRRGRMADGAAIFNGPSGRAMANLIINSRVSNTSEYKAVGNI